MSFHIFAAIMFLLVELPYAMRNSNETDEKVLQCDRTVTDGGSHIDWLDISTHRYNTTPANHTDPFLLADLGSSFAAALSHDRSKSSLTEVLEDLRSGDVSQIGKKPGVAPAGGIEFTKNDLMRLVEMPTNTGMDALSKRVLGMTSDVVKHGSFSFQRFKARQCAGRWVVDGVPQQTVMIYDQYLDDCNPEVVGELQNMYNLEECVNFFSDECDQALKSMYGENTHPKYWQRNKVLFAKGHGWKRNTEQYPNAKMCGEFELHHWVQTEEYTMLVPLEVTGPPNYILSPEPANGVFGTGQCKGKGRCAIDKKTVIVVGTNDKPYPWNKESADFVKRYVTCSSYRDVVQDLLSGDVHQIWEKRNVDLAKVDKLSRGAAKGFSLCFASVAIALSLQL